MNQATAEAQLDVDPVKNEVRESLRQFGYDLFRGQPTTFAPVTEIPVPVHYSVGPGDTLRVQLYGRQNGDYTLTVNRDGSVSFPEIGPVNVTGLDFGEVRNEIKARISEQLLGVKASVTLGRLRSMRVFVSGDVRNPGSYLVSSLSTMTNALFVSGGIERMGSLRRIQLKREGEVVGKLDLYDLLLYGDSSGDQRLRPGDVIFVPPIGPTIGVGGEVRRPAIYEIKGERSVDDMISLAGGLLPSAHKNSAQLVRVAGDGTGREVLDADVSALSDASTDVADGDVIRVYSSSETLKDVVVLKGHVRRPGGYPWHEGMSVTDLVRSEQQLLPQPDLDYVVIRREVGPSQRVKALSVNLARALQNPGSEADLELRPRDSVLVFSDEIDPYQSTELDRRYPWRSQNQSLRSRSQAGPGTPETERQGFPSQQLESQTPPDANEFRRRRNPRQPRPQQPSQPEPQSRQTQPSANGAQTAEGLAAGGVAGGALAAGVSRAERMRGIGGTQAARDRADTAGRFGTPSRAQPSDSPFLQRRRERNDGQPGYEQRALTRYELLAPLIEELRAQASKGDPERVVTIRGHVLHPGEYPLEPDMTVDDLIRAGGGLRQDAYSLQAELTRFIASAEGRSVRTADVKLGGHPGAGEPTSTPLRPFDTLTVKPLPEWQEDQNIQLVGEVRFPGRYTVGADETLREVIRRAGGLTDHAYPEGAVYSRERLRQREKRELLQLRERLRRDIAQASLRQAQGAALNNQEASDAAAAVATARTLLDDLQTADAVGRLVINLPAVIDGRSNVTLEGGDYLAVPRQPQSVTVLGEVPRTTSHLYQEGLDIEDYISRSGGASNRANEEDIYIVRADGAIITEAAVSGFWGSGKQIRPGDVIVVPIDVTRVPSLALWQTVASVVQSFALTVASASAINLF